MLIFSQIFFLFSHFFTSFLPYRNNIHNISDIALQSRAYLHQNICVHALVLAKFRQRNRIASRPQSKLRARHTAVNQQIPQPLVTFLHYNSPISRWILRQQHNIQPRKIKIKSNICFFKKTGLESRWRRIFAGSHEIRLLRWDRSQSTTTWFVSLSPGALI